jgi:hypothetical protein
MMRGGMYPEPTVSGKSFLKGFDGNMPFHVNCGRF